MVNRNNKNQKHSSSSKRLKTFFIPFLIGTIIPLLYNKVVTLQTTMNTAVIVEEKNFSFPNEHEHEHEHEKQYEKQQENVYHHNYNCANWIKEPSQRRVLFINESGSSGREGVGNMDVNLRNALIWSGFDVTDVSNVRSNQMSKIELTSFHLIFYMITSKQDILNISADGRLYQQLFTHHDILCKLRIVLNDVMLWNDVGTDTDVGFGNGQDLSQLLSKLDTKQILLSHPDPKGTFLGSHVFDDEYIRKGQKRRDNRWSSLVSITDSSEKVGLFKFGKGSNYTTDGNYQKVLTSLIDNGFTMHIMYDNLNDIDEVLVDQEGIILHGKLTEEEYAEIASQCVFSIGKADLLNSSNVWIDLANGATILRLAANDGGGKDDYDSVLSQLGQPYLYDIDLRDTNSVIQAAEWAVKNRFESYIPSDFRSGTMNDRVCSLLEDESLCFCPNPLFIIISSKKKDLSLEYDKDTQLMDCRATFFVKKGPIFSALT
jgi:hypothetical protein